MRAPLMVKAPKGFRLQTLDPTSPKGTKVIVPERVAKALKPEIFRGKIPDRVTLSEQAPPFTGELREEQFGKGISIDPSGHKAVATLRRAWNYVGFCVDPGTSTRTVTAALRVLVRGMQAIVPGTTLTVTGGGGPVSSVAFLMAARCELVVFGETGDGAQVVDKIRGTIWGMSEQ